jgi:hypothetical protein
MDYFIENYINKYGYNDNYAADHSAHFTVVFVIYLIILAFAIYSMYRHTKNKNIRWWLFPLMVVVGFLITDIVTGIYHVYFDNSKIVDEHTAAINRYLNATRFDFQRHHIGNGSTIIDAPTTNLILRELTFYSVPLTLVSIFISNPLIQAVVISHAMFVGVINKVHQYAHKRMKGYPVPWIIEKLQDYRIILSPATHEAHHNDTRYNHAVFTGWSNPLLNVIREIMFPLDGQEAEMHVEMA